MTTLRGGKPFALSCLLTILLSQTTLTHSEVVPAGRRRERAAQREQAANQTPQELPAQQLARPVPAEPVLAEGVRPESPAPQVAPNEPVVDFQQQADPLLALAERAISKTSQRYLDADENWPWQIMHGVVALRRDFVLTRGDDTVSCIDFISDAPMFRGECWWQATEHGGRAHPFNGVKYAFEGHVNQFLALLSMSNLPLNHEFKVADGQIVTMADMVSNAKMTVNNREEITWTLWFLTHYLDVDAEWTNEDGEPWSIEELVRLQTNATVTNAPCGGTHGLFAIAYARNTFLHKHGRLQGVYYQADQKIKQHIELARSLQNYDGSFSSEFFKGPGHSRDFNERLMASGHMLEWLMMALPQRRLNEAWIRRAVASISTDLIHNAAQPAKCGPLYHALNSLIMYRDRVKPTTTETQEPPELALDPQPSKGPGETASRPIHPLEVRPVPQSDVAEGISSPKRSAANVLTLPAITIQKAPNGLAKKAGSRLADLATQMSADPDARSAPGPRAPTINSRRITIEPDERSIR